MDGTSEPSIHYDRQHSVFVGETLITKQVKVLQKNQSFTDISTFFFALFYNVKSICSRNMNFGDIEELSAIFLYELFLFQSLIL